MSKEPPQLAEELLDIADTLLGKKAQEEIGSAEYIETKQGHESESEIYEVTYSSGEKVEVYIHYWYHSRGAEDTWGVSVDWDGVEEFSEFYTTENELAKINKSLRKRYPELAEAGAFED